MNESQLTPDVLEKNLVVEAEAQFGHAAQVDSHLDGADNLAAQDSASRAHQDVHRLNDVEKDLILAVLDVLGAPRHGVGDGRWKARLADLMALLRDVLLQDLRVGRLRVPKVHEFVEQLVDDYEVVADALLFQLVEVLTEHLHISTNKHFRATCVRLLVKVLLTRTILYRNDRTRVAFVLILVTATTFAQSA